LPKESAQHLDPPPMTVVAQHHLELVAVVALKPARDGRRFLGGQKNGELAQGLANRGFDDAFEFGHGGVLLAQTVACSRA
jgi:hypothetical protein